MVIQWGMKQKVDHKIQIPLIDCSSTSLPIVWVHKKYRQRQKFELILPSNLELDLMIGSHPLDVSKLNTTDIIVYSSKGLTHGLINCAITIDRCKKWIRTY